MSCLYHKMHNSAQNGVQAALERTRSAASYQNQCVTEPLCYQHCCMGVRYGHHTADTYGDSTSSTCVANINWQDMIPNTEVLQRCAQNGIEHHIKRAQLRWSGHLVRMADDRIPKTVFYGELGAGHRTPGGQRKRYKDVLKVTQSRMR